MVLLLVLLSVPVSIIAAICLRVTGGPRDDRRCAYCGYSRAALMNETICPECGKDPRPDARAPSPLPAAVYCAFLAPTALAVAGCAVLLPSIAHYAFFAWLLATAPAAACLWIVDAALSPKAAFLAAALLLGPLTFATAAAVIASGMYKAGLLPPADPLLAQLGYGADPDIMGSMYAGVLFGGSGSLWLFTVAAVVMLVQRAVNRDAM